MRVVDEAHRGIGGSSIVAILELSPYRTRFDCWSEITGRAPRYEIAPSDPALWGSLLEATIADHYARTMGVTLTGDGKTRYCHDMMTWLTGRPDRLVNEAWGLEIKTTAARKSDEWGSEGSAEVPDRVAAQAQHYMVLTGMDRWDVAVLIGGQEFKVMTLRADTEVQGYLLSEAAAFWESHVLTDIPPPADSSIGARDYLGERLRASANRVVAAPDSLRETFERYRAAQVAKSNAEAECDVLRAQLASQVVAADAKGFSFADATFKAVEMSGRIDYKKLSEELMQRAALDDATKLELSSKYMGKPAVQWRTFAKREG